MSSSRDEKKLLINVHSRITVAGECFGQEQAFGKILREYKEDSPVNKETLSYVVLRESEFEGKLYKDCGRLLDGKFRVHTELKELSNIFTSEEKIRLISPGYGEGLYFRAYEKPGECRFFMMRPSTLFLNRELVLAESKQSEMKNTTMIRP